jgi:hypothetical protein
LASPLGVELHTSFYRIALDWRLRWIIRYDLPMKILPISKLLALAACGLMLSQPVAAQPISFEYDLRITVDPSKRAAYLKQSGEAPSTYEPVFNLVKGSMQVATVVDLVDIKKDRYHISSKGTLGSVLSTVLNNQTLIRDSVGTVSANGLLTNTYQEKRGNTDLLLAKVDTPKKIIQFFKVSSRTPPVATAEYSGQLLDMLTVGYQFIGRPLPTKSIVLPVTDGRSLKRYTLNRGETVDFTLISKQSRQCVSLNPHPRKIPLPLRSGIPKKTDYHCARLLA